MATRKDSFGSGGTTIGVGAGVTESAWDSWWPQFKQSYNGFINTANNNWMHYR